jgi:hypothetical protein
MAKTSVDGPERPPIRSENPSVSPLADPTTSLPAWQVRHMTIAAGDGAKVSSVRALLREAGAEPHDLWSAIVLVRRRW